MGKEIFRIASAITMVAGALLFFAAIAHADPMAAMNPTGDPRHIVIGLGSSFLTGLFVKHTKKLKWLPNDTIPILNAGLVALGYKMFGLSASISLGGDLSLAGLDSALPPPVVTDPAIIAGIMTSSVAMYLHKAGVFALWTLRKIAKIARAIEG